MSPKDPVPFILNLTLEHPPFFTLTSQFVDDGEQETVVYYLTCQPEVAKTIEQYEKHWAETLGGQVKFINFIDAGAVFSVTIPIKPFTGDPNLKFLNPRTCFLDTAQLLVWVLTRLLEANREKDNPRG